MPDTTSDRFSVNGEKPFSDNGIIGLGIYLVALAILLLSLLAWTWPTCGDPPDSSSLQQPSGSNLGVTAGATVPGTEGKGDSPPNASETAASESSPRIISVSPASGRVNATTQVTVKGSGFQKRTRINFGGRSGEVVGVVADDSITAVAPVHHAAKVDVAVINPNGTSDTLAGGFEYTCNTVADGHVLMLVIFAGALGGTIHAIRSLYWYVGNRKLCWSWVPMYVLLPFSGAAIATIFFLIVRGGFMDTAPDRETSLVIIAIAALAGLFSQQAALKLQDIANALLAKPEPGENSRPQAALPAGTVTEAAPASPMPTMNPTHGPAAGGTEIQILGTGFTSVRSLTFDGVDATDSRFDATSSAITAKSPAHAVGEVTVILTDDNDKTVRFTYRYE